MSDFYVGYLPKAPERLGRAVLRIVLALNGLAIVLALLLVFGQQPFADSTFEFLQYRDYQGLLVNSPYPSLLTAEDRYLLVAPGKRGAAELVRGIDAAPVELRGSLIRRGDKRMLEVVPGSIRATDGSPRSVSSTYLGVVELAGEIVDSKCYFGVMNPGNGKVHRACAVRCISGGIPPAFVARDASGAIRTLLLSGMEGREILDLVAEPVTVRGRLQRSEGDLILTVERRGNKPAIDRHRTNAVLNTGETSILPRLLAFPIPRPIEAALERVLGIREMQAVYGTLRSMGDDRPISARLLEHLEVTHRVAENDLYHVPRKGPAVLVVNHPFGILEGAVLTTILPAIRSDVKFLANDVLAAIPELRSLVIPVDPMGGAEAVRSNPSGVRATLEFLAAGGLLVVFPAGEVSHFQWKELTIADPAWSPAVARILAIAGRHAAGLTVIPAYVSGANSALFQAAGLLHPRLRTALLARELLNKRRAHVDIRIGSGIAVEKLLAIPTHEERTQYLRWRTYLLASRQEYKARTARPLTRRDRTARLAPIAPAGDATALEHEVGALPPASLLARSGDLSAYLARRSEIPAVLSEIGRLREITFRAAGEGTGKMVDIDEFDRHYLHLFVWSEARREVVGAYRMGGTDRVPGLYTATLFDYGPEFLERMGPALELGRSFVRAEYQKNFAPLLLLWKGIGRYVARNPRYRILFGPVSISNQYQSISRELMVSFLERHASLRDWVGLVSTRNAFRPSRRAAVPESGFDIEDLSVVVSDIEPARTGVPVLLRQYLKLGGKLLGFNVDPKFSNALDGLILVDLTRTEPRLLERYLGKAEAAEFLAFQRGRYGAQ